MLVVRLPKCSGALDEAGSELLLAPCTLYILIERSSEAEESARLDIEKCVPVNLTRYT